MTLIGCRLAPPEIHEGNRVWSESELASRVNRTARALRQLQVDTVGICLTHAVEHVVVILACMHARVLACLLDPNLPEEDVANRLADSGASVVITRRTDLGARLVHPDQLLSQSRAVHTGRVDDEAPVTIVFTSGSANRPKAVVHRLRHHLASAKGVIEQLELGPGDRWLLTLPLYHVSGLSIAIRCALARASIVLSDEPIYSALVKSKATHVSLVSTQLHQLLDQAQDLEPPASLKAMIVGGGPVSESALRAAREKKWPVCTTYGLTEMASMVTITDPGRHLDTAGLVLPGRELTIAADGEILVRGDSLCAGYLKSGTLRRSIDADGWFHTRDLGRLDSHSRLVVLGRKDDMFISGGENIAPQEIENALMNLPGITNAVVVPVPDALYGARPVAFIQGEFEAVRIRTKLAYKLPKFKIPKLLAWPADLPAGGLKAPRRYLKTLAKTLT